jgi:hypothetical protein
MADYTCPHRRKLCSVARRTREITLANGPSLAGIPFRQGASHARKRVAQHMRIDLSRPEIPVTEKLLDRTYVTAVSQQLRRGGMTEHVVADRLGDPRPPNGRANSSLYALDDPKPRTVHQRPGKAIRLLEQRQDRHRLGMRQDYRHLGGRFARIAAPMSPSGFSSTFA